jgi:predicted thioredoxin/glutaredoxin
MKALGELNVQAEVLKVADIRTIIERGVMSTPALIIDGKLVLQGRIPTVDQIKHLIKGGRSVGNLWNTAGRATRAGPRARIDCPAIGR